MDKKTMISPCPSMKSVAELPWDWYVTTYFGCSFQWIVCRLHAYLATKRDPAKERHCCISNKILSLAIMANKPLPYKSFDASPVKSMDVPPLNLMSLGSRSRRWRQKYTLYWLDCLMKATSSKWQMLEPSIQIKVKRQSTLIVDLSF